MRGVSCSFGGEFIDTRGGKLEPNRPLCKVIHEASHPSRSPSYRVSRQRSFTPQPYSENTKSGYPVKKMDMYNWMTRCKPLSSTLFSITVPELIFLTLMSSPYISFCKNHLSKWNMMCVHVWASQASVFMIVSAWHLNPPALALFYLAANKLTLFFQGRTHKSEASAGRDQKISWRNLRIFGTSRSFQRAESLSEASPKSREFIGVTQAGR